MDIGAIFAIMNTNEAVVKMIILRKQLLYNYKVSGAFFLYKIFTDFFYLAERGGYAITRGKSSTQKCCKIKTFIAVFAHSSC